MVRFGRFVHACEVVGSTQDIAREMALSGAPAGTVVTAEFQTAGRGRQGRVWHAPRGANVCLTAIGEPIPATDAWQVALVAGVAVAQAIGAAAGVDVRVRFPNDVYRRGRKLAGVLVEAVPAAGTGAVLPLVGIGVNVNVPADTFPAELAATATSLQAATGHPFVVAELTAAVLANLTADWCLWRSKGLPPILELWHALADPGTHRAFLLDGQPVSCRVLDIAADGVVTLEAEDGTRRSVHAAQVLFE